MITRQTIETPNYLSHKYVIHNFKRSLRVRYEARQHCGPYVCRRSDSNAQGIAFYMDMGDEPIIGDATINLRLQYAHDIVSSAATGYYCDNDCFNTLSGIVARLPRSRGFLAGWTMGNSMCGELHREIYDCERDAARAADSIAESVAESERYHHEIFDCEQEIESLRDQIQSDRQQFSDLIAEIRQLPPVTDAYPGLRAQVCQSLQQLRESVRDAVSEIRSLRDRVETLSIYI